MSRNLRKIAPRYGDDDDSLLAERVVVHSAISKVLSHDKFNNDFSDRSYGARKPPGRRPDFFSSASKRAASPDWKSESPRICITREQSGEDSDINKTKRPNRVDG
jgi:hypothetical protein